MNIQPEYLDKHGATSYCSRSTRSLDYDRAHGDLPYYKVGKKVLFKVSDLDAYMQRFRVDPTEVLESK